MKADMIIKGKIYNGIDTKHFPEMFAVKDGVIIYVGDSEQISIWQDEYTKVYDLRQGLIIPGMYEGHAHVCSGIDLFRGVNLFGLDTPESCINAVQVYIKEHPDQKYIIGRGFQNGVFGHMGPTAKMLDMIGTDQCIILDSEDCHSSWVNTRVMRLTGIDSLPEIKNGVIVRYKENGRPTGWLKEKAMEIAKEILPCYGVEEYKEAILRYQEMAVSYGIVSIYEPIMNDKRDTDLRIKAYHELDQENKLICQFRAGITMDPSDGIDQILQKVQFYRLNYSGSHFMLMGVKIFIDGVIEGHTAYLREPYYDTPNDCGYNMWEQEKLNDLFVKAAQYNIPIHVHAIGDAAIDSALEGFEEAYRVRGKTDIRNCITHLQILDDDQFDRFKDLGIIAVTNPYWHYKNPFYFNSLETPYLGRERAEKEYPMKSFFDHGIVVTQASDWPVTYNCNPLIALETAVTRMEVGNAGMQPLNEQEVVTVVQMMKAITSNGAYQMELERNSGSIDVGKKADFVILDQDLFTIKNDHLANTQVLRCFIEGKEVYHK